MRPRILRPKDLKLWNVPKDDQLPSLPRNYGECIKEFGETDPCPHVRCRHHLYLDVTDDNKIKLNYPDIPPDQMHQMPETCSLRQAAKGSKTLVEVAEFFSMSRERVRQLEVRALQIMRPSVQFYQDEEVEEETLWDQMLDPKT